MRSHGSRRQAETAGGSRSGFSQFPPKLLNACRQHLPMNLRMNGIYMSEVSWCEYNSFVVQKFVRGQRGARRRKEHGLCKSGMRQIGQERGAIPTGKSWPAKIHAIDLYPFPYDVLTESFEKRFLCL